MRAMRAAAGRATVSSTIRRSTISARSTSPISTDRARNGSPSGRRAGRASTAARAERPAKPTPEQERFTAQTKEHVPPTPLQRNHVKTASMNGRTSSNRPIRASRRSPRRRGRANSRARTWSRRKPRARPRRFQTPRKTASAERRRASRLQWAKKPIKAEPLNSSRRRVEKLPGAAQPLWPGKPPERAARSRPGARSCRRRTEAEQGKPEPLNMPKAEEKLPGARRQAGEAGPARAQAEQ